jgi:hypothetical protein
MNALQLIGIGLPLVVAVGLLQSKNNNRSRLIAAVASGLSASCYFLSAAQLPSLVFAALALAGILLLPRQDAAPKALAGLLIHTAATHLCYTAPSLNWLALGWWMTLLPFVAGMFGKHPHQSWAHGFFLLSAVAMTVGAFLPNMGIYFMLAAVVLRKGVFPLQGGSLGKFEHGPLIPAALLFNSHLGAVVMLKTPDHPAKQWLGIAALVSAVVLALRTFAEKKPRRMLGLISLSQASFILAGLTMGNEFATRGAMLHWMVVAIASVGLAAVIRSVEVRVADARGPRTHLGLAVKTPRLATFFLICALALIGLPGTLGYVAEDLLFHGALEAHPLLGLALPVATAFNAIHLMRLFGMLFLGVLPKHVPDVPDALARERWPLALACVCLVVLGLLPHWVLG